MMRFFSAMLSRSSSFFFVIFWSSARSCSSFLSGFVGLTGDEHRGQVLELRALRIAPMAIGSLDAQTAHCPLARLDSIKGWRLGSTRALNRFEYSASYSDPNATS